MVQIVSFHCPPLSWAALGDTHTLKCLSPFEFDLGGTGTYFDLKATMPPIATVQKSWVLNTTIDTEPFFGLPRFIIIHTGHAVVFLFQIKDIIAKGESMATIAAYIGQLTDDEIRDTPMCSLPVGRSLWVPFGCAPIILGIGAKGEDESHKVVASVSHFVCCAKKCFQGAIGTERGKIMVHTLTWPCF
jgi:hypothetical protein